LLFGERVCIRHVAGMALLVSGLWLLVATCEYPLR
jgi:hypothetical protein